MSFAAQLAALKDKKKQKKKRKREDDDGSKAAAAAAAAPEEEDATNHGQTSSSRGGSSTRGGGSGGSGSGSSSGIAPVFDFTEDARRRSKVENKRKPGHFQANGVIRISESEPPRINSSKPNRGKLLNKLQKGCRTSNDIVQCLKDLGQLRDIKEYNMAITAWGRRKEWEHALGLLEEMQRRGLQPNVITWNAAISACEKGAQWERALGMLEEMQRRGVQPDVITWSAVISSREQSGSLDQAIDLFLEAQSIGIFSLWLNPATIDLHDLSLSVAKAAAASVLADVSLQPSDRQFFDTSISTTLTIVTGRGNRSDDNEAVLRPGILAMLQSEYPELDSTINRENDGRIEVMVKKQRTRPGSWTGASGRQ